ncbi:nucleotidyltransferase family protein [Herbaspirillum huttiense]|uniref:nucleotidyltransferase family protein n=1 Tax=Herbaspirillum huttiense TaxID=863372 RepID=UPI003CD05845
MVSVETVAALLRAICKKEWILEVWIFGSFVRNVSAPSDIDVFIKYQEGHADDGSRFRRDLEQRFIQEIDIPLHLLMLTEGECSEHAAFLNRALRAGIRVK